MTSPDIHLAPYVLAFGLFVGCAPRSSEGPGAAAPEHGAGDQPKRPLDASPLVVTESEALTSIELAARARARLESGELESARADYELLLRTDLTREDRQSALFGLATAQDLAGDTEGALVRYQDASRLAEQSRLGELALVRSVRLLLHLERFSEARDSASRLRPAERSPVERVLIHAAIALGALEVGELVAAEREILRGRTEVEEAALDRVDVPPVEVGALYFALGELRRLRALSVRFSPIPPDFGAVLETRCQLVLDAQSAYSETMRAKSAHWSAMAGVRVGELYQSLHEDLLAMPPPAVALTEEKRALFEGALRLRYSVLLEKATRMMSTTVRMLDRTGEPSPWRARALDSLTRLERARRLEDEAIDRLPYTREQLKQVLEALDLKGGGPGKI